MSAWDELSHEQKRALLHEIFELDEQYGLPITSNYPREQDGRYLFDISDFAVGVAELIMRVNRAGES